MSASTNDIKDAAVDMKALMDKYTAAWNAGDMNTIMSYFSDTDLDYADYGKHGLYAVFSLLPSSSFLASHFLRLYNFSSGS